MQKIYPKLVLPLGSNNNLNLISKEVLANIEIGLIGSDFNQMELLPDHIFPIFCDKMLFETAKQKNKGYYYIPTGSDRHLKSHIKQIKQQYPTGILGVSVNNSYDLAMSVAEMGADFVSFDYKREQNFDNFLYVIETWANYTIIQSMLIADELSESQLKLCLEKGIDFICFAKTFWNNPNSVVEKIENLNNLLNQYPFTIINFDEE